MANELKSHEQEFVRRMLEEGPELKRRGFEILQARENPERYFDALLAKGLFEPSEDPTPEKVGRGWRFENWAAAGYLKALAKRVAGDYPRLKDIGQKILGIIRALSATPNEPDGVPRNFFTQMAMVELLTQLPQELSSPNDAATVGTWLKNSGGLASYVCDWLGAVLDCPNQSDKALALLDALTRTTDEEGNSDGNIYWIKEILTKRGKDLGRTLERPALDLLKKRIVEVMSEGADALASLFTRPAIEDHPQNAYRPEFEGALVVALRDGLLGWIDADTDEATAYVRSLFSDPAPIVRRIALHSIDERFDLLGALFEEHIAPELFTVAYRHELHRLLSHHFSKLAVDKRTRILEIIAAIEVPQDEKGMYSRYERARWLSACVGQGVPEAEQLMSKTRTAHPQIEVPEHPDFDTYSESWSGSGPSPYSLQDVFSWNGDELLIKLRGFVETDRWKGPTRRSLSDTFAEAIRQKPTQFISLAATLRELPWTYRYSVLNAFNDLSRKENETTSPEQAWWPDAWAMLTFLAEAWVADADLVRSDKESGEMFATPDQNWVPGALARLIEEGTKKDDRGIPVGLLGRARAILNRLLEILPPEDRTGWKDALTFAINSARGRVLEALIRMTLKEARAEDKASGTHAAAWARLEPTIETEAQDAHDAKYEFSALAGVYLPQLYYLSPKWIEDHLRQLIPLREHRKNADAFLKGLSHVQLHRALYQLLNKERLVTEILDALPDDTSSRERFLHGIALAYLWGDEPLDGVHVPTLMSVGREADLADFLDLFRRVTTQLDDAQKTRVRALVLHVQRAQGDCKSTPVRLLAVLVGLTTYVDELGEQEVAFLINALRLTESSHYDIFLNKELNRLLDSNPKGVAAIADQVLKRPHFHDYQDEFKKLIRTLHAKGFVPEAMSLLNELRWNTEFRKLATDLERA